MELVTDWEDSASTLYDVSLPLDPTAPDVQHLVARMLVSVVHHGGIGLAAPQVGINRRLFVADVEGPDGFEAFHNPVILAYAETTDDSVEGCLSIPGERVAVTRPTWVEYEYDEDDGSHVELRRLENPEANPWSYPARVFFHEFDHLNGILMTDRARTLDR
jgi:peptide deformylase